jgi:acyl-CoA reductase-like NAD-dependent aldehyde dehydrogenase
MENQSANNSGRIEIQKTYKIFIDGKFPRTESGRYFAYKSKDSKFSANICLSSRKDLRDALTSARAATGKWAKATAYNRGQILYRIAEMLEGRTQQFVEELMWQGATLENARIEVQASVDRLIYYAGWADKYQQVFSTVNPVASSHFNFSILEPTGVVGVIAPEDTSLLGLVTLIAPVIVGGNTCVVLASQSKPLCAITFAEVLATSDVPSGVVNILTGSRVELVKQYATHMDINAISIGNPSSEEMKMLELESAENIKRIRFYSEAKLNEQGPYQISDFQEVKTTWHPIGM